MDEAIGAGDVNGLFEIMATCGLTDVNEVLVPEGRRVLYYAAGAGQPGVVRALIKAGAEIDAVDIYGQTALLNAALHLASVSMNVRDLQVWRRAQDLTPTGLTAVVQILILDGADVNLARKPAYPPIHFIRTAGIPWLVSLAESRQKVAPKRTFWNFGS